MKGLLIPALLTAAMLAVAGCDDSHPHHARLVVGGSKHYKPGDGSINLENHDVLIRAGGTREDARVGVDGSLTIGDKLVDTSAAGQAALRQYDASAVAIEEHGIAIGVAGAEFGWRTFKDVMHGLFHGDAEQAGKRADEGAKELVLTVRELCTRLDTMYQSQERAAAAIPEFKPYAVIARHQVDDCYKDDSEDRKSDDDHDPGDKDADDKDGNDKDDSNKRDHDEKPASARKTRDQAAVPVSKHAQRWV